MDNKLVTENRIVVMKEIYDDGSSRFSVICNTEDKDTINELMVYLYTNFDIKSK